MALFGKREDEAADAAASDRPAASASSPNQSSHGNPAKREGTSDVANIGKSISIKGDLTGNEDLSIEGKVEGKVDLPNNQLTVGANGVVKAEIHAKAVIVIGHVAGNVNGAERVEIQATGIVDGDVAAPRLVVAEGAVINGAIHMSKKPAAAGATPQQQPGTPGQEVRKTA